MTQKRKKGVEQLAMRILSQYRIKDNPGQHLQTILDGEQIQLMGYDDWAEDICGRFMYIDKEPVIFYNSTPMCVDHFFTFTLIADTIFPVVFICEASTRPAK